ncbi:single-stranded DNA-binding protein [Nonomuraea sp. NPDC050536]|uniref:single-stranded DNA-binding protein n=1 Tax=Nonomuraea sp. NPDC050536 TaxID=3364366 RepID=UPI0037C938AA
MNDIYVTLTGNVAAEPRQYTFDDGVKVTSLRVLTNHRYFDKKTGQWTDGERVAFAVRCWRELGDNVAQSIRVGHPVVVSGKLRIREFEGEEGRRFMAEVEAISVGHNLRWGTGSFAKPERGVATRERRDLLDEDTQDWAMGPAVGHGDLRGSTVSGSAGKAANVDAAGYGSDVGQKGEGPGAAWERDAAPTTRDREGTDVAQNGEGPGAARDGGDRGVVQGSSALEPGCEAPGAGQGSGGSALEPGGGSGETQGSGDSGMEPREEGRAAEVMGMRRRGRKGGGDREGVGASAAEPGAARDGGVEGDTGRAVMEDRVAA